MFDTIELEKASTRIFEVEFVVAKRQHFGKTEFGAVCKHDFHLQPYVEYLLVASDHKIVENPAPLYF